MSRVLNGVDLSKLEAEEAIHECAACHRLIAEGESYTLVRLGPGRSAKERERARRGDAYNPVWASLHWACATGEED